MDYIESRKEYSVSIDIINSLIAYVHQRHLDMLIRFPVFDSLVTK
jgi:hypothetical protein